MAPYISSHPRDSVRLVPSLPGTQLDILQNLVANTRLPRSAMTIPALGYRPSVATPPDGGLHPAVVKTSAREWQCVWLTQAGPPVDGCAGRVVASATKALLDHTNF